MPRVVFTIACLIAVAPAMAQAPDRIEQLTNDVDLLTTTVADQGRRLEALERHLQQRSIASESNDSNDAKRPTVNAVPAWHNQSAWSRLKSGMSEAQVIAILGPPTLAEGSAKLNTLFYRGKVVGSGVVSGNIKLMEDRAYLVNAPVF